MLGAIVGDVVGSHYEHFPTKSIDFDLFPESARFTDDTVLTVAVADWILHGDRLHSCFHRYVEKYPYAGYGDTFVRWAWRADVEPYNSWGNGSAMRVSPCGYAAETLDAVLDLAERSAVVTHNHPEGIRGARATAGCVFLARSGASKSEIRDFVVEQIEYDLERSLDEIRPTYSFDVSCQGSVPQSIQAFLESDDFESAIRLAISLGGDADTMACVAGAIAEPFYGGVPGSLAGPTLSLLDEELTEVLEQFRGRYDC